MATIKLTAKAACRVARLDRDRFNEHVASGAYPCAPETVPGRSRLFEPDDMLALFLFRDLMEDGMNARRAGQIACSVSTIAREVPDEPVIAYVSTYVGKNSSVSFTRLLTMMAPHNDLHQLVISGSDVRDVRLFNVAKLRELIAHYTEEECSIIGEDD